MSDASTPASNRLADSTSPYLRQHAQNPVDWYPWGPEALERAKAEDRPILLSVGYSACHWCHVMAHESFEDPDIAALMNAHYVCVKVDREERPDIDAIYQKVVALMGQGGGWPLTVFLTPDQRPFYGGTYFPPQDRYGRPGFARLLVALAEVWTDKRDEAERQAAAFMEGFADIARSLDEDAEAGSAELSLLAPASLAGAGRRLLAQIDPQWGGFGRAPKFPSVPALEVLLELARHERAADAGEQPARDALHLTLEKMWRGGIYDHLRGGFARYSVDREWLIPHFEKMLYDNGLLLGLYADADAVLVDPEGGGGRPKAAPSFCWRVVRETVGYLLEDMRAEDGSFFSATDADSEGVEGKYFCWTPSQLRDALGPVHGDRFAEAYGVSEAGNFEDGMSVLHLPEPLSAELDAALAGARGKLLEIRYQRVPPARDDKVLSSWNALVITGLCKAAAAAERRDEEGPFTRWRQAAERALEAICTTHVDDQGRLLRASWRGRGHTRAYLEDLALLGRACLDVHELSLDPRWHERAAKLAGELFAHYAREGGGFYQSADDGEALIERTESQHDSPLPSGVAGAVELLARLDLGGPAGHDPLPAGVRDHLEQTLRRFRSAVGRPHANAGLITAARWASDRAVHVTLRGPRFDAEAVQELAAGLRRARASGPVPVAIAYAEAEIDGAEALVCRAQSCSMPIRDLDGLIAALAPPA